MNPLRYLGQCHHIALALNDLTPSVSIVFLYGYRKNHNGPNEEVMIHVGIKFEDCFYDELGARGSPRDVLREFVEINEEYTDTEIFEFEDPNSRELKKLIKECGAGINQSQIDFFKEWAVANRRLFPFIQKT